VISVTSVSGGCILGFEGELANRGFKSICVRADQLPVQVLSSASSRVTRSCFGACSATNAVIEVVRVLLM